MLAFTFPGQGSQKPQMGVPWRSHASWALVEEASDAAGRDIGALLCEADADELRDTRNAQLTTLVLSLVVEHAVEQEIGVRAAMFAGHSLGEYAALEAAGAIAFTDAVKLVVARSNAMHEAGHAFPGTMAAVLGLDDAEVEAACDSVADVWVANYNAPGQVVIAGSEAGVEAGSAAAKARGAKRVMGLHVAGAFHTPFMQPAEDRLDEAIGSTPMSDTERPVVSNVDATPHHLAADFAELLTHQLVSPVRWSQSLTTMQHEGATGFIEMGPGNVLTGLVKRTLDGAAATSVSSPDDMAALVDWIAAHAPD